MAKSKPTIAILPFDSMSGDPMHQMFAEGLSDDVGTELGRFNKFDVIDRRTTQSQLDKGIDSMAVGQALDAQFMLQGSVRFAGNRVRVAVQMTDSQSGKNTWAERFDHDTEDEFAAQDNLSRTIAGSAAQTMFEHSVQLALRDNPNASPEELTLQGWAAFRQITYPGLLQARALGNRALEIDKGCIGAWRLLSYTYGFEGNQQWTDDPLGAMHKGVELAETALSLNDLSTGNYIVLGSAELGLGNHERAMSCAQKALKLNASDLDARAFMANALTMAGRPEEALEELKIASELNPKSPAWHGLYYGRAFFLLDRLREAEDSLSGVVSRTPKYPAPRLLLAAVLAQLDRLKEAREQVAKLLHYSPLVKLGNLSVAMPYKDPEHQAKFEGNLTRAGLGEVAAEMAQGNGNVIPITAT